MATAIRTKLHKLWNTLGQRQLRRELLLIAPVLLIGYSLFFRLYTISDNFWLLGDQIRDWRLVGGPFRQLPLTGTPRVDGGYCIGPIFYWVLWTIRHTVAPFFDNLPHSGAYGLATLHALAEAYLLVALLKTPQISTWVACCIALLITSSPWEAGILGTIWNPNMAATFSLLALGSFLRSQQQPTRQRLCMTTVACVLAVQCHMPALFMAGPVMLAALVTHCTGPKRLTFSNAISVICGTVFFLEIPWMIHTWQSYNIPKEQSSLIAKALHRPFATILEAHWQRSWLWVTNGIYEQLINPLGTPQITGWLFVFAALGMIYRFGLAAPLTIVTLGTWLTTWAGWSFYNWDIRFEFYWLVGVQSGLALFLVLGLIQATAGKWAPQIGLIMLLLLLAIQPTRYKNRLTHERLPEYATLVTGARKIAATHLPMGEIIPIPSGKAFPRPAQIQEAATFLVTLLGGDVNPQAPIRAIIDTSGHVFYQKR